ncbi:DUF2147 domain-containing protein [Bradyrhizobium sp. 39]|uniref:DUF2147 domain-containing protein n=1 Tax=Bradyrhizobium sp. 39 TaxID=2782673 RepID=UPI001FF9AB26|nr:DUF2147 domain-containing protein [Bradyrhizobium sp. 39]MCK1400157.1 DUF2147 domain-containing protein [Bradyrhizobium sp. 39]
MRKLLATAAFLLASTAAQAQYTFDYGGRTIRIDPDRGTVQIPGVYDNTGQGKAKKTKNDAKAAPKADPQAPQQAKADPQPPANPAPAPAPVTAAPAAEQAVLRPPSGQHSGPAPAAAPTRDLNSPLGVWLTEEKEGKVRIEQCGSNLCGYSVDSKSNQNGEQVLINMKPGKDQNKDQKWSGRILDPNSGSTYDSTIALKGTDRLRVQGCAFGGMFCGGQTWTRVN